MISIYWMRFKQPSFFHRSYEGRRPVLMVQDPEFLKQLFVKKHHDFPNRRVSIQKHFKFLILHLPVFRVSRTRSYRSENGLSYEKQESRKAYGTAVRVEVIRVDSRARLCEIPAKFWECPHFPDKRAKQLC